MREAVKTYMKTVTVVTAVLFIGAIFTPLTVTSIGDADAPGSDSSFNINKHVATADELQQLKQRIGTYNENTNYNQMIDGHGTGLVPPTEEGWQQMADSVYTVDGIDGTAPGSVDNTNDVWFPPIGNQGSEGSCVCFAVGYYTKTYQEAKEHNWNISGATWEGGYYGSPSAAYQDRIMSPDFLYHQVLYWNGYDGGSTYSDAMNLIHKIGCATWEKMPYDPTDSTSWPSEAAWREAPLYRGETGFNYQYFNSDADIADLKTFLANDHLAVISINANYYGELTDADLWTLDTYDGSSTNHANTIVGYDDDFGPYTEQNETRSGAFKIANSWGKGFNGDHDSDGCYWISYEAIKQEVEYYMFMEDAISYEPELLAVFEMEHDHRTQCDIDVGMGSVSSPDATKHFNDWYYTGAPTPFPSNPIVMDITEFNESHSINNTNFFLKVYDGGNSTAGTVTNFSIEYSREYNTSGYPYASSTSEDTPIETVQSSTVHPEAVFDTQPAATPPQPDFTYSPTTPAYNDTVTFNDSSTDDHGTIVNWTWDFGDGAYSYGQYPAHQYAANGSYTVSLTVVDDDNMSSTCNKSVTVCSSGWDYWTNSPNIFNVPGGNVGIGTDEPGSKLHVNGSLCIDGSASHLFFVDSGTGNVGIGTSTPQAPLTIQQTSDYSGFRIIGDSSSEYGKFYINPHDAWVGQASNRMTYSTQNGYIFYNSAHDVIYNIGAGQQFRIRDSGSNELIVVEENNGLAKFNYGGVFNELGGNNDFRVESSGNSHMLFVDGSTNNVGIGISNPARPLHINDVMRLEPRATFPTNPDDGDLCVQGSENDFHIYCWLNGDWRKLD